MKKQAGTFGCDIDVRTVDPAMVPDIRDITVKTELPPWERMADLALQMGGNPYLYKCGGIVVKTSFRGARPLQEVLEDCLRNL